MHVVGMKDCEPLVNRLVTHIFFVIFMKKDVVKVCIDAVLPWLGFERWAWAA
jgi:hypothetical protein